MQPLGYEIRLLRIGIALFGSCHECSIQDLARHRKIARIPQGCIKAIEQTIAPGQV